MQETEAPACGGTAAAEPRLRRMRRECEIRLDIATRWAGPEGETVRVFRHGPVTRAGVALLMRVIRAWVTAGMFWHDTCRVPAAAERTCPKKPA